MAELESAITEEFILAVKKHEALWNLYDSLYKNRQKKNQIWREIGIQFGISADDCKRKWKGLRSSYSREVARRNTAGATNNNYNSGWKYTKQMVFLREHIRGRSALLNYVDDSESSDLTRTATPSFLVEIMMPDYFKSSTENLFLETEEPTSKRRRNYTPKGNISLTEIGRSLNDPTETNASSGDDDNMFCQMLSKNIKKISVKKEKLSKLDSTSEFIMAVEKHEALWNLCNSLYNNRQKKNKIWREIGIQFGITTDDCKRKWKGLRSSYSREVTKRSMCEHDVNDHSVSGWMYTKQMDFLRQHMRGKNTLPIFVDDSESIDITSPVTPNILEDNASLEPFESSADNLIPENEVSTPTTPKRKKNDFLQESLLGTIQSVQDFLKIPKNASDIDASSEEDGLFCQMLLKKIKRFPVKEKNHSKLQILSFVSDIENILIDQGKIQ